MESDGRGHLAFLGLVKLLLRQASQHCAWHQRDDRLKNARDPMKGGLSLISGNAGWGSPDHPSLPSPFRETSEPKVAKWKQE
jgi:hypothetical protein